MVKACLKLILWDNDIKSVILLRKQIFLYKYSRISLAELKKENIFLTNKLSFLNILLVNFMAGQLKISNWSMQLSPWIIWLAGLLCLWPYCRILVYREIQGKCINWCFRTCHLTSSWVSHVVVVTGSRKLKVGISDSVKFYNVCAVSCEEKVIYFKS